MEIWATPPVHQHRTHQAAPLRSDGLPDFFTGNIAQRTGTWHLLSLILIMKNQDLLILNKRQNKPTYSWHLLYIVAKDNYIWNNKFYQSWRGKQRTHTHTHTHSWITLLSSWNQHNIINQLFLIKEKRKWNKLVWNKPKTGKEVREERRKVEKGRPYRSIWDAKSPS